MMSTACISTCPAAELVEEDALPEGRCIGQGHSAHESPKQDRVEPKVCAWIRKPYEQISKNPWTGGVSLDLIKAGQPRSRSVAE